MVSDVSCSCRSAFWPECPKWNYSVRKIHSFRIFGTNAHCAYGLHRYSANWSNCIFLLCDQHDIKFSGLVLRGGAIG